VGRPSLAEPRDRQLLIRLTANQMDVLEAQAYLERVTPSACAHRQLAAWLDRIADDPSNGRVVIERNSYGARQAETHSLDAARSGERTPRRTGEQTESG
jgi:hypothetical protein